jgi:transcriptional regulator with AAA-type ATPase domain
MYLAQVHLARQVQFPCCNGGTVFLDEVGETSLPMQAKLLRVIQNREIQRVGSPEVRHINVRPIAATNRDLRAEVLAGKRGAHSSSKQTNDERLVTFCPAKGKIPDCEIAGGTTKGRSAFTEV